MPWMAIIYLQELLAANSSNLGRFWLQLLAAGVVAILGGLISGYVTSRVLIYRMRTAEERLKKLEHTIETHSEFIHTNEIARANCELRMTANLATRGELGQIIVQVGEQYETLRSKLDGMVDRVHERVDEHDRAIATLNERVKGDPA